MTLWLGGSICLLVAVMVEDDWELTSEEPPDLQDGVVEGVLALSLVLGKKWLNIPVGGIIGPIELEAEWPKDPYPESL